MSSPAMKKRLYLVSLGCPKNLVDSEVLLGLAERHAFAVVTEPEEADLLVVNTCAFIQPAVEESIEVILGLASIKQQHPEKKLVVCGCLPQRYGRSLAEELREVDLFLGVDGVAGLSALLAGKARDGRLQVPSVRPRYLMDATVPRRLSTPAHRAYLKVTEGCANRCSYCLIPRIRGSLRSRALPDAVAEAARLADQGVQELTLVAQDLTAYGLDLGAKINLKSLLAALLDGCPIPWIRLLYLHPARIDEALLDLVASEPRILPYLDIPLQHVNTGILAKMQRPYDRPYVDRLLGMVRAKLPQAAIRTTFMVGFPGEDDRAFAELEEFVRSYRLEHVGVFPYYNEEGCAAEKFAGQVAEDVKEARRARLMEIQQEISKAKNQRYVGTVQEVLVEGRSQETDLLLEGRTRFQAADIDGCVYIAAGTAAAGDIVKAEITEAHAYDLVGEIVPA